MIKWACEHDYWYINRMHSFHVFRSGFTSKIYINCIASCVRGAYLWLFLLLILSTLGSVTMLWRCNLSNRFFKKWFSNVNGIVEAVEMCFFLLIFRVLIENRLTSLYLAKWIWVMKMKKSRYREWLCEREGGNEIKQRGKLAFCIKFEFVCRFDSIRLYIYPPFPMYCFTSKTTDWSLLRSFHTHFAAIFYLFVRMETKYIWKFLVLYYNIGNRVIITGVFFAYVCVCVCYCERTFH